MVTELVVLRVQRLGTSLEELRKDLRATYKRTAQVNSTALRGRSLRLAEEWMVEVVPAPGVKSALGAAVGDLNIEFNRLLTYSERRTLRSLYDKAISSILTNFSGRVVIPLKQARDTPVVSIGATAPARALGEVESAFVGHSFAAADREVVEAVKRTLMAFHIRVETGERPSASTVSDKVKRRIDRCDSFVGIFTRRDKISGKDSYTTSTWVIDEKAYAIGGNKKLVLIKDSLVESIGGLHGDYEYLEFAPNGVLDLVLRLVELLTEE